VKHLENPVVAIDEFLAQEARLDGCVDGAALGLAAKPSHEMPRKTIIQSGRSLRCRCHP
jgi:hypothetical protein